MSERISALPSCVTFPRDLYDSDREIIERLYGGTLEDIAFIYFWRKWDDSYGDAEWDGYPFCRGGLPEPIKIQHPENEKATWFLFPKG